MKSLLIVVSLHHGNTAKIADAMAKVLGAEIRTPEAVRPGQLEEYDLLGFGSGIHSAMHHPSLLSRAARLPQVTGKHAFLFSTSAILEKKKVARDHERLRTLLLARGCHIVGEFSCRGFNTNSLLKWFGGMNKGRPDADDLRNAEEFARKVTRVPAGSRLVFPGTFGCARRQPAPFCSISNSRLLMSTANVTIDTDPLRQVDETV